MSRFCTAAILFAALAGAQPPSENFASLEGRVTDVAGQPLRKAGLTLRSSGQPAASGPYYAETGVDGAFSFARIPPGGYTLAVERTSYLRQDYRSSPAETFSTIALAAGQRLRNIDFKLARAATLSGRVLDADNDPVANVSVRLLRRTLQSGVALSVVRTVSTNESGAYTIPDLPPGKYYLDAGYDDTVFSILGMRAQPVRGMDVPPYYADTFYPDRENQAAAVAVPVLHDDLPGMDIHLRKSPAFRVSGNLTGTVAGHPLEQCQIRLAAIDRPATMIASLFAGQAAQAAKDGSFEFAGWRFAPGDYFLTVFAAAGRPVLLASQRLTIRDRDVHLTVNLQPLVELHGKLAIEGEPQTDFSKLPGTPPPSVTTQVNLFLGNGPMPNDLRSRIQSDGSFAIANVAPGVYQVYASGLPVGTWVKSIRTGSRAATEGRIEIADAVSPLEITLSRATGQITGTVEDGQGKPAAGSVTLFSDPPGTQTSLTGVGDDGKFTFSSLPPGSYRLYAWEDLVDAQRYDPDFLDAHQNQSIHVTVTDNGTARVTLRQIPSSDWPR